MPPPSVLTPRRSPSPPAGAARVVRVALPAALSPGAALRCLRGDARPFALIGAWFGGGAVLGADPVALSTARDDPFDLLDRQPRIEPGHGDAVGGGWVGYLGYELRQRVEPGAPPPPRPRPLPEHALAFYDHVLRQDSEGRWWFEALWTAEADTRLRRRLRELRRRMAAPPPAAEARADAWQSTPTAEGHARAVAAAIGRIHAGDLFQANLALRLEGRLQGDPLDLFVRANEALPTDRAAFTTGPWGAVLCLSPELFLRRRGREVTSAPIKGTRPRPADPGAAERLRRELEGSAKDRAENVMIVDLVRNDLGRVCEPGTVRVEALGDVEAHAGVWHMVSRVCGRLREGVRDGDLVRAAFPPGSVTGAPKVAALAAIAELESTGREAYTGSIGMASPTGGLELNVAIRTLEAADGRIWLGVGGGVVADSDPLAEAREAIAKADPLLAVLGGGLPAAARGRVHDLRPVRRSPRPTPRPDPRAGVFETILVRDGAPVALHAHLERLRGSVRELYGADLPAGLGARIAGAAAGRRAPARLRVLAVPAADGLEVEIETGALPPAGRPASLATVVVPGGLGRHKWLDRRLLEELEHELAPALPLLVDVDGFVLEASRANVFAAIGGRLVTPPCDGRILPGVTRARVLAGAGHGAPPAEERPLELDELAEADEVLVTSALRGVRPVGSIDGRRLAAGPVFERMEAPRPVRAAGGAGRRGR